MLLFFFFFFQAEDGIRDKLVTGVQTCALPIFARQGPLDVVAVGARIPGDQGLGGEQERRGAIAALRRAQLREGVLQRVQLAEIGRASCRERGEISVVAVSLKKKKKKREVAGLS